MSSSSRTDAGRPNARAGSLRSGRTQAPRPSVSGSTPHRHRRDYATSIDYADYGFDHEELLQGNANAVPLFSNDRQASCGAFE